MNRLVYCLLLLTSSTFGQGAGSLQPHWMVDGSSFWYAEGTPEGTEVYVVDPKANTKIPLFYTDRLRRALMQLMLE